MASAFDRGFVTVDSLEPLPEPDRERFWSDVDRVVDTAGLSPVLVEIVQGMCALQAHNEAEARNFRSNDIGSAETRNIYAELVDQAFREGRISRR